MFAWIKRLRRFEKVDFVLTRVEAYTALVEQYPIIKYLFNLLVGALMIGWTWLFESWLPMAIVAGVGAVVLVNQLTLKPNSAASSGTSPAAEIPPTLVPSPGGMTQFATGTVEPMQPFDRQGLYVGQMDVSLERLAESRVIKITISCFNATKRAISVQGIKGELKAREARKRGSRWIGIFPPLYLVQGEGMPKVKGIMHGEEFFVILEQSVPPEIATKMEAIQGDYRISLDCNGLDVTMASDAEPNQNHIRLPLWDGMMLSRTEGATFITGRIAAGTGRA